MTLWAGYLLNLVPYQLIARSKFVYHYVPALMVGVLLWALSLDWVLALVGGRARRTRVAAGVAGALFLVVGAAFWYWGLPYAYGYKISAEANRARLWSKKW